MSVFDDLLAQYNSGTSVYVLWGNSNQWSPYQAAFYTKYALPRLSPGATFYPREPSPTSGNNDYYSHYAWAQWWAYGNPTGFIPPFGHPGYASFQALNEYNIWEVNRELVASGASKFGMQVFGAAGNLFYASTDITWNQVDMVFVSRSGSFTKSYPVLAGKEVLLAQFMINPPPIDRRAIAHNLSVSGTTVTVSGGSEDTYVMVLMR